MEDPIQVKVERTPIGFVAYDKDACLCPECFNHASGSGKTIQDALEDFEDTVFEYREKNYKWS